MRNRLTPILATAALLAFAVEAVAADSCPAERAVYELVEDDSRYEIGFQRARNYASIASDLYLYLTTPQRTYWFTFSVSNGYSGMTLIPVTDPNRTDARSDGPQELVALDSDDAEDLDVLRSLRFYALDDDFTFWFEPPNEGEPAPAYVMVPEIGLTLWYGAGSLTDDPTADRDPMPRGIFEPDFCRDQLLPPAWP
ncbi:hypothetical protein GCM10007989_27200 [Devosia pacifica]|uniref:DUF1214 domain-containing protein n=1 Tax=Devosia pacifica TaxID=1335967 RepID=A0A918SB46_9HYPH|nr:hypothetical protein [Devosia pacifica]GHA30085.1 hypothetical protein GCM10007989_27200 [Devosia pacifica]